MSFEILIIDDNPDIRLILKDLINEVLDEREYQKKLNGPYDVPEYTYRLDELQE